MGIKERESSSMRTLDKETLTSFAFGINGAGGGGNVAELYNPDRQHGAIVDLVEELDAKTLQLVDANELPSNATVSCIARLGSPGAKADNYASEASSAVVQGIQELANKLGSNFPSAIFPVEATAGQMARACRAALAASTVVRRDIPILDGDVCGGLAVPSVPLAFGIEKSLAQYPDIALIQIKESSGKIIPSISLFQEKDPTKLEHELRSQAAAAEMGAVWFAWLMSPASSFKDLFTPSAVSSSIRRGEVVQEAVRTKQDPAEALLEAGEIEQILTRGVVTDVVKEEAPGFAQFRYTLETPQGETVVAARNEYIVVYRGREVLTRAPYIINVIGKQGPIQSHVLKPADEVAIVAAIPQSLTNNPEKENEWQAIWQKYWDKEKEKGVWSHPY